MWGQKFGYVVGSALSFPFKNFSKIRGLLLHTLLVMGVTVAVIVGVAGTAIMQAATVTKMQDGYGGTVHVNFDQVGALVGLVIFLGGIFLMFAFLPYVVGVTRTAILDEKADSGVITSMFASRQLRYLWARIKIVLMAMVLFLPAILLSVIAAVSSQSSVMAGSAALGGFGIIVFVAFFASIIVMIILIPRWLMAPVMAAMDQGSSLKASMELTKGSWWLIVLSMFVVQLVTNIGIWVGVLLGALIISPFALLLGPVVAGPLTAVLFVLLLLLVMLPTTSLMGYLYLVMTDQVHFAEVSRKKEVAK